jgi:hypothetical protein
VNNTGQIANTLQKLKQYKKKYYLNLLFKGFLISLAYLLIAFLGLSLIEYQIQFNSAWRTALFVIYIISALYFLLIYITLPLYHLINNGQHLSNKKAAAEIGKYFPEIGDKLLNFMQLSDLSCQENSLIQASILQKSEGLNIFNFSESIEIRKSNKKYFPYVIIPVVLLVMVLMFAPYMITEGSYRILKFNKEFVPTAPFKFHVKQKDLIAYKGEPFQLNVTLSGQEIPNELYIIRAGIKQKLQKTRANTYEFTFNNPQTTMQIHFEGAGFSSVNYQLNVYDRPAVENMAIELEYPAYTGSRRDRIENTGNLIVPEGTVAKWWVQSKATDNIVYQNKQNSEDQANFEKVGDRSFTLEKAIYQSEEYQLSLINKNAKSANQTSYSIQVIEDKSPDLTLEVINDSSLFNQVALAGEIGDDYGFSQFNLNYSIINNGKVKYTNQIKLPFKKDVLNQKYFKLWRIDSLLQNENDVLQYFVIVSDNDAINGAKSTRSSIRTFNLPSQQSINQDIKKTAQSTENQLDKTINASTSVNKKLQDLEDILKTKRNLNWEDKKLLENILNESEGLKKRMEEIMNQSQENSMKREKFNQQNPELKEQSEQLQSLMEEMLKDENEDLLKKLEDLMQQNNSSDDFRKSVEDLKKREKNRLREMKRLMELFKRLEIQYDMNQVMNDLEKQAEKQAQLSRENEEKAPQQEAQPQNEMSQNAKEALEKQEALNQQFEKSKDVLEEIKKRNQELNKPNAIKSTKEDENKVDEAQQESSQKLKKANNKGASQKQKEASDAMKQMSQSMSQMASGMQMEMLKENIDDLKDIVDNLLKLSFRQEELMNNFKEVNASDPRFIDLSEEQLNMMNDSKIIEDSLTTLAERVFQIKSFITKEMTQMNESMQKSINALKERDKNLAVGQQQFAMTSINNLALLLDDVLEQMQMDMQASQGMGQESDNKQQPSPGEMQKSLNQATQELSKGQKTGRQKSEQLAELAAEQARIKEMIKKMMSEQSKGEQEQGGGLGDVIEQMEQIEEDLVNKRLDGKLIERQKKIVTRLLEAEKAKQEQEEEDERKGETATDYEKQRKPNAFDDYLKQKEKEIEQLQSVPPSFTPYYKNEINQFYKRLKSTENNTL